MHDSSEESVTPKFSPTPLNNPPKLAQNIPAELDSDPILSDSSLSDLSDSSDDDYSKLIPHMKTNIIKCRSKNSLTLSKSAQSLQPIYLQLCKN